MENPKITTSGSVDKTKLESKVIAMYTDVAQNPEGEFHFEMGRDLAIRLGYLENDLAQIPKESVDSFAGVGYHFALAAINEGEAVLDLGSGSGMDAFIAALKTGNRGSVNGIDITEAQLEKARGLAEIYNISNVSFKKGYIEDIPVMSNSYDVVISNGVINLSADKTKVFNEISRVLKSGGRLALSDIVTEIQMPDSITCNSTLWAACIGGAMQQDNYRSLIESAGLEIIEITDNPQYGFISKSAQGASKEYGVKSSSLLAVKM